MKLTCYKDEGEFRVYLNGDLVGRFRRWEWVEAKIDELERDYLTCCRYYGFGAGWNPGPIGFR